MLNIEAVNHVGVRISEREVSVPFYELPGFEMLGDLGFDDGHPIVMKHACGVTLNLLGDVTHLVGQNILMDVEERYSGYTHIALTISSMDFAREFMAEHEIPITGSFEHGKMEAIFIRDPDRNVIELDAFNEI